MLQELKLKSIGGGTMEKLSRAIMATLITDQLAKSLTWVADIDGKVTICNKFFITTAIRNFFFFLL